MTIRTWAGPAHVPNLIERTAALGVVEVSLQEEPELLIWTEHAEAARLAEILNRTPSVRWVQLPSAGVEDFIDARALDRTDVAYASCRGAFAVPVAEHAIMLLLAVLRNLKTRARSQTWGSQSGQLLAGSRVLIVGAGGVGLRTASLLQAFHAEVNLIGRTARRVQIDGAIHYVRAFEHLDHLLDRHNILILACPVTAHTRGLIGRTQLERLDRGAHLVNVGRGPVLDTQALLWALDEGHLHGAGLDVTDPEPLPIGHPLWDRDDVLITPHTADTLEMVEPLFIERTVANVQRLGTGQPLLGEVSLSNGY
ncbi:NAD(P)-dependent oxidoreductase [Ruania halotolerans]|uniref:NAD(P)-dependent oxidoreductase n=1 Tax=Ruania halotolerans TaxID=2897773 RepID=UPI001E4C18C3|nr:NAD(P)-dependent oxidoreductase [Ruania halotolerans]UFU06604.1 hydroxyacid dehydrogenase [Ruania halotolerans]